VFVLLDLTIKGRWPLVSLSGWSSFPFIISALCFALCATSPQSPKSPTRVLFTTRSLATTKRHNTFQLRCRMATVRADSPIEAPLFSYDKPSSDVFPDGIKTSGQTHPNLDQIKPYSTFPKEITGKTVWKGEEFKDNPEKWTHRFTAEEVQELSDTADAFIQSSTPLTGITRVCFHCTFGSGSILKHSLTHPYRQSSLFPS
jgi:hypothetical protein